MRSCGGRRELAPFAKKQIMCVADKHPIERLIVSNKKVDHFPFRLFVVLSAGSLPPAIINSSRSAVVTQAVMSAFDPKRTSTARGLQLLTGPFQMMWMETNRDILATFGDAGRVYECSEKPTPSLNKFSQEPQRSCNHGCKQCKHRTKGCKIQQKLHCFAAGSPQMSASLQAVYLPTLK